MAADLFQHPKIYIVIAVDDELVGRLKEEFSKKPLVEVYVLSPRFFLQPEFVYNPLWQRELSRIIWVLQEEQSVLEVAAITRFLTKWQEITTVLGITFSPPPVVGNVVLRGVLNGWKNRVEIDEDIKTRIMLNLPRASLVIGHDVLLDSWTKKSPIKEILELTAINQLPSFSGLNFFWQSLDEFLDSAWEKMFNPLVGMRFWLYGKKMSGKKFTEKLGQSWEVLTKGQWSLRPNAEAGGKRFKKKDEDVPFFAQKIQVRQETDQVEKKWGLFVKLAVREVDKNKQKEQIEAVILNEEQVIKVESEKKELEIKQEVIVQNAVLFPRTEGMLMGKNLFDRAEKQIKSAEVKIDELKNNELEEVSEKLIRTAREERQKINPLRVQIRPLGGSKSQRTVDPLDLIVKPGEEREIQSIVDRVKIEKDEIKLQNEILHVEEERQLIGGDDANKVRQALMATGLRSVKSQVRVSWIEKGSLQSLKRGKSRLVEEESENSAKEQGVNLKNAKKLKKKVENFECEGNKHEQALIEEKAKLVDRVKKNKELKSKNEVKKEKKVSDEPGKIEKSELRRDEVSLKVDMSKYEEIREKLLASSVDGPPLPSSEKEVKKRNKKKFRKRLLIVICFLSAIIIAIIGCLWWIWQNSERDYYAKLQNLLNVCSGETKCDWMQENQIITASSLNFKRQLELYQPILPLTQQSEFANWEKLVEQMRKYQENQKLIEQNWLDIYMSAFNRKNEADSPLLWQNQENLIWQNDQLILNMQMILDKVEANPWFSSVDIGKVKTQFKQEQSRNNQIYQKIGFWRQVLGQKGLKNYAILLFNSSQIRPGGGVMEAVLDVQMVDGQIKKVTPYAANFLNARLGGKPIATGKIAGYLGKKDGSFMDIGFDGDFEVVATKGQWYLSRALGKEFDGIIALNSNLIRGGVFDHEEIILRQSGEKVNKATYEDLILRKSRELDIAQERGQFFSDLLISYFDKQRLLSREEVLPFGRRLASSLNKGEIELWFSNDAVLDKAKQFGWSGSILSPDCGQLFGTNNCQGDSLYYFVTDLTGKSQADLPRISWEEEVTLNSEGVKHEAKIIWENRSVVSAGKYYFQLYLPQKATEAKILIDGVQAVLDDENGLLVDFQGKNKVVVSLQYFLPRDGEINKSGYMYSYLKHSPVGLDGVESSLKIKNRFGLPYKLISPVGVQEGEDLAFTHNEAGEDMFITVGF